MDDYETVNQFLHVWVGSGGGGLQAGRTDGFYGVD